MASLYVPCPKCGSGNSELAKFTWWGGVLGPRMLTHVKCHACGNKYNGKTGGDNVLGIVIYSLVAIVFGFVLMFVMFFLIWRL